MSDNAFMARALRLAAKGLHTTSPNPRVGCVIVKQGQIIGEGWHERAGQSHAEVIALQAAGANAKGATAYVTLEPCSHFGKTPPCADALIGAGINRVVAAMTDPNPLVSGRGLEKLRAASVEVDVGILADQARELNIGFVSRMERGRPWVRTKLAASLDGKTALMNGASQWITGEDARRDGHRWRARSCAMLTGIGTVLGDDPRLTVHMVNTSRQPVRIVVDSRLDIPLSAQILQGAGTIVATISSDELKAQQLRDAGAEILHLPAWEDKVDLSAVMRELTLRGINEVTVEAGAKLNASLLQAGLVDEIVLYQAPVLLGDAARGLFALPEMLALSEKVELRIHDVRMIGQNVRIIARTQPNHS
ncbi:MAG TPA: bifunctional diaminohydroxyphosphoribosylaminopyrimidine deaminase/5-amino-6-(5-phosphoribosylamino)uracil reductase RibD [Burkholderiales bacterium]|nr:bifunctional diaminohydroxyphosphoribosylaminopyrimidine deaminase/5-amino-6-(5-phosphoribosylamino)uracil reductase RibD [Burkholderiales bacterium]